MSKNQKQMEDAGYMRLSQEQIRNIFDKGFCYAELRPGHIVRVTTDDLRFNKEEIDELIKNKM